MVLRWVHAGVIVCSAAVAALFGVWCLAEYGRGGGTACLVWGIVAFAVSLGLILYDSWFLRKTRTLR
jgi:hypothetical protein